MVSVDPDTAVLEGAYVTHTFAAELVCPLDSTEIETPPCDESVVVKTTPP
jgi:hypothetical protein